MDSNVEIVASRGRRHGPSSLGALGMREARGGGAVAVSVPLPLGAEAWDRRGRAKKSRS